ncbi:MAG: GNAT family N-acetyltransferase [Chloroflexi bacterium]|nr:MAG: GNAT family N-acetyltransferase [Chloroflexota bacterium]
MAEVFTIRRIRRDEVDAHRDVRLRALAEAPTAFETTHAEAAARPPEAWVTRTLELAESDRSTMFVADEGTNRLAGMLGTYLDAAGNAELYSMWVDPAARRHGLGRRLIDANAEWAREHDFKQLLLWVTEGNEPAVALYLACGFELTGESQPHPTYEGHRELEMRLALIYGKRC